MLVPLTRQKFEQLIPRIATGAQYRYCWGKSSDFLKRLLISVVSVVVVWLLALVLGEGFQTLLFALGLIAGLYWLWGPVLWASLRNGEYRRYKYSGFFRGRVLDVFITEELVGKEETVNNKGDLVIVENRERRINLEVGDETGFTTQLQVPLLRAHQVIAPNQVAEMLVLSNQSDLSRIAKETDIYIPSRKLWVSDYPFLRRDVFTDVSSRIRDDAYDSDSVPRRKPRRQSSRRKADW
jgi:hypothetical protein